MRSPGQHEKEVVVVLGDRVVDDDLHVERGGEHIELQDQGENQGLDQYRHKTRDLAEEIEQRELFYVAMRAERLDPGSAPGQPR